MRSAGNFNSEWGYLAPAPSFMRTVRVVMVATAIGATAGAAVVLTLIDRPSSEHDRTASIAAHAIVTSVQAAPITTMTAAPHSATETLAAPIKTTATSVPAATPTAQSPARVTPQTGAVQPTPAVKPAAPTAPMSTPAAVATQPSPAVTPAVATAPQASSAIAPQAKLQPQPTGAPLRQSIIPAAPEISAASETSTPPAPKPPSGLASLSDAPSAPETTPAEAPDQALIPPQTVPPVKKPRPHAAYAANNKYQSPPSFGAVLRRLFKPPSRSSYYPNR